MAAKLVKDMNELKVGKHVVELWGLDNNHISRDTVDRPAAINGYLAKPVREGRLYISVPGPCPHCREFGGLVRTSAGEWVTCKVCWGGWL